MLNLTLKWPINPDVSGDVSPQDPEIKAAISVHAVQATEQADTVMCFMSHFSSSIRLKRMVAWLLRFKSWVWLLCGLCSKEEAVENSSYSI